MAEITIDPEIANLCRGLTDEEKAQLEANLIAEGCRDALVAWGDILLDGHNRFAICKANGLSFEVVQAQGVTDRGEAVAWVIKNQLGRRNLSPEEQSYLRGKRYEAEKIDPTEYRKSGGHKRHAHSAGVQNVQQLSTAEKIGREHSVSELTVRRDEKFAKAVDQITEKLGSEVGDLIRSGKSGVSKTALQKFAKRSDEITMDAWNELRFSERAKKSEASRKAKAKPKPKAPPISKLKRNGGIDPIVIDRMRQFMNAITRIAETPIRPRSMARDPWPNNWRRNLSAALPAAIEYLTEFDKEMNSGADSEGGGNAEGAGEDERSGGGDQGSQRHDDASVSEPETGEGTGDQSAA